MRGHLRQSTMLAQKADPLLRKFLQRGVCGGCDGNDKGNIEARLNAHGRCRQGAATHDDGFCPVLVYRLLDRFGQCCIELLGSFHKLLWLAGRDADALELLSIAKFLCSGPERLY